MDFYLSTGITTTVNRNHNERMGGRYLIETCLLNAVGVASPHPEVQHSHNISNSSVSLEHGRVRQAGVDS